MVVNEKPYKLNVGLSSKALRIVDHVARNGDKHFAEIARDLNMPAYTVQYQCHRLKVRGLIELYRKGTLTFAHFQKPKVRRDANE
jgi:predicted transcriptional regulator